MRKEILIIGYGNPLRGDDGAGPMAAGLLAADAECGAEVLSRHQLTPELSEYLCGRALVIFVDAATTVAAGEVVITPLAQAEAAKTAPPGLTHHVDAGALLLMAARLYDARPQAFLVAVGGASFELGEGLSPAVDAAVPVAAAAIRRLIREHRGG
jgi:hydrogenase maturation protease